MARLKCSRSVYCAVCWLALALTALHPFIHGTPLDSGLLDSVLVNLQGFAMQNTGGRA